LYEKQQLGIPEVLQNVSELFIGHPTMLQQFQHFAKPVPT
jgi:hypothetical protein